MKAIISLAIFLMATLTAWADSAKDRWTVYQSYSNITEIEPAGTVCFVLASNSVFSYDTTDGLVQTYDKAGVMSDVGVSHIAWAKASKRLVVVYTNSNIDLLSANGDVINAPDFYLKTTTLDKTINHIDFDGPYAYLSTAFGVVKLNTRDGAIMDTYDLGTNVSYTYVKNGYLYAESKERGRLRCKLTDNLLDKSNWVREDGFTTLREDRTNVQDAQTKLWWTKTADGKLTYYALDADGKRTYMTEGVQPEVLCRTTSTASTLTTERYTPWAECGVRRRMAICLARCMFGTALHGATSSSLQPNSLVIRTSTICAWTSTR